MTIRSELIDALLKEYKAPQEVLVEGGLLKELTKAVIERCLETELDTHLGYPKHGRKGNASGNSRNGHGFHCAPARSRHEATVRSSRP
jgi:putative transposase